VSLSQRSRNKKGLFSSLKGLDNLTKRDRDKRPSAGQVWYLDILHTQDTLNAHTEIHTHTYKEIDAGLFHISKRMLKWGPGVHLYPINMILFFRGNKLIFVVVVLTLPHTLIIC
jgi:hypothetical protein